MLLSRSTKGLSMALVATACFSSYTIFGKVLLEYFPPHTLAAMAQTVAAFIILIFSGALPQAKKLLDLRGKDICFIVIFAILAGVIAPLLLFQGLTQTSAANTILIGGSEAVFTEIIAVLWLHERMSLRQIMSVVLMFAGIYVIVTHAFTLGISFASGDVLILLASVAWAVANSIYKKYLRHISPDLAVLMRNVLGSIIILGILPFIFPLQHQMPAEWTFSIIVHLVLFALIATIMAQFLWYRALKLISIVRASIVELTSPLFGVFLAVVVLREQLEFYHLFGGVLIMAGLVGILLYLPNHAKHRVRQELKHVRA